MKIYNKITEKIPIKKGWSQDRKYWAETQYGDPYLLRVSPAQQAERVKHQYELMLQAAQLRIPMNLPREFGVAEEGPYLLLSWIDGEDAEEVLPALHKEKQYAYGLDAGRILRKIHSIPAPADIEPWAGKFNRKIDRKIAMYENCPLKYEGGEAFLTHIAKTRHLLSDRPQCFQHGDYHTGNMMIDDQGRLTIIDFEKWDYGDPWEEFNRIVWCAQISPAFASGLVDGYFGGEIPQDFWNLLALYICSNALGSLPWAIPYGEKEIRVMREQAAEILDWYDHFRTVIPNWYHKEEVL